MLVIRYIYHTLISMQTGRIIFWISFVFIAANKIMGNFPNVIRACPWYTITSLMNYTEFINATRWKCPYFKVSCSIFSFSLRLVPSVPHLSPVILCTFIWSCLRSLFYTLTSLGTTPIAPRKLSSLHKLLCKYGCSNKRFCSTLVRIFGK